MIHFVDTCALLNNFDYFSTLDEIYLCSITLKELEGIKSNPQKSEEARAKARLIGSYIWLNPEKFEIIDQNEIYFEQAADEYTWLSHNNDSRICLTAYLLATSTKEKITFYTDDIYCANIARRFGCFEDIIVNIPKKDEYTGYYEIEYSDEDLANFYENIYHQNSNVYNLLENQYLNLINNGHNYIYVWRNGRYEDLPYAGFSTRMFGDVGPMDGDPYQTMALDSLHYNKLTVLRGKAGSGKSYLAFTYLFFLLEKHEIDKIIIFTNTVATADSCKLGFYPGTKDDKLLDSQIGNFLVSKVGSITEVERMIAEGTLELIPISDCRGMDTTGQRAGVYFTEAQNATKDMMKLVLQRIGEDSVCIIEGDDMTQTDMEIYKGSNNGLKRLSQVYRGQDYYGEVTLKTCHRSRIAAKAEEF